MFRKGDKMNHKKLLIFDFDGTIADTTLHVIHCVQKCAKHFSLMEVSEENIQEFIGSALVDVMKKLGAREDQLTDIKEYYREIFLEDLSDILVYDGVKEVLEQLKARGYTLAIATNRGSDTLPSILEFIGITNIFSEIVCADHVINRKPHPEMVDLILNDLALKKEDTLVLGDTSFDILMAQNAGCDSCYVCHEKSPNESVMMLQPDFVIYQFKELL